ncbi:MAG: hypothetical protein ACRC1H_02780, partial [Caldilineaceae bacterium]
MPFNPWIQPNLWQQGIRPGGMSPFGQQQWGPQQWNDPMGPMGGMGSGGMPVNVTPFDPMTSTRMPDGEYSSSELKYKNNGYGDALAAMLGVLSEVNTPNWDPSKWAMQALRQRQLREAHNARLDTLLSPTYQKIGNSIVEVGPSYKREGDRLVPVSRPQINPIYSAGDDGTGGFSLSPGQARYDAQGNLIAQGPADTGDGFSLAPGAVRYDAQGNVIARAPEASGGAAGGPFEGTGLENQMLNIWLDPSIPPNDPRKQLAVQRLTQPRVVSTPEGTYTVPGYNLGQLQAMAETGQVPAPGTGTAPAGTQGIPGFTAKPATEGEKQADDTIASMRNLKQLATAYVPKPHESLAEEYAPDAVMGFAQSDEY